MKLLSLLMTITIICYLSTKSISQANEIFYTPSQKQAILDLHNLHRCSAAKGLEGKLRKASNMVVMDWDDRACVAASRHAKTCEFRHDSHSERTYATFPYVGQNIAYTSASTTTLKTIDVYFSEYNYYNWSDYSCSRGYCGHFVQEVYHNTRFICAAKASCQWGSKVSHVINYAPGRYAGDYITEGEPCSNCPAGYTKCMNGCLCALPSQCTGQSCTDNSNVVAADETSIRTNVNSDNLVPRVTGTYHVPTEEPSLDDIYFTSNETCDDNLEHCTNGVYKWHDCISESVQRTCPNLCKVCHSLSTTFKKDMAGCAEYYCSYASIKFLCPVTCPTEK